MISLFWDYIQELEDENQFGKELIYSEIYIKVEIINILLKDGGDPCLMNGSKESPILIACHQGSAALAKLFIERGT